MGLTRDRFLEEQLGCINKITRNTRLIDLGPYLRKKKFQVDACYKSKQRIKTKKC